ncbi:hypothetical protein [[Phormidium ambiguum] IAM M-71]|nr:hypothetical protein [Phormidium ambiguum]
MQQDTENFSNRLRSMVAHFDDRTDTLIALADSFKLHSFCMIYQVIGKS